MEFVIQLQNITFQAKEYFSYSILWFGLVSEIVALSALFLRKRTPAEHTKILYLFKWQYLIGTIYVLNMILNDPDFSSPLFRISSSRNIPHYACRILNFLQKFIYCLPSWMQVVIIFFKRHRPKSLYSNPSNIYSFKDNGTGPFLEHILEQQNIYQT